MAKKAAKKTPKKAAKKTAPAGVNAKLKPPAQRDQIVRAARKPRDTRLPGTGDGTGDAVLNEMALDWRDLMDAATEKKNDITKRMRKSGRQTYVFAGVITVSIADSSSTRVSVKKDARKRLHPADE